MPGAFMDGYRPALRGRRHMTVAGHYLAAQAAFQVLEAGGNAIDAGVAAGIALGVVQSDLVNVAGVAPILIRSADTGETVSISGLGYWPQAADIATFARAHADGVPEGILRQIVPAAPDAWITALERFGTMQFREVARAAIALARDGFVMYPLMAELLASKVDAYARWPSNAAIYLPDDRPPQVGEMFYQRDLAATLQYMADEEAATGGGRAAGLSAARHAFYRGDIARRIVDFHAAEGGLLSMADLADYRSEVESAPSVQFGAHRVYACGPWCQGPLLLQILNLLDAPTLHRLGHNSAGYIHHLVEAIKLAAADRERWYADPRFADVPLDALLSDAYAAERRQMIGDAACPGLPPAYGETTATDRPAQPVGGRSLDTSYVCVVDAQGNVFSATPSDTSYDGPVVPGTGIVPSTRGSQSRTDPTHPAALAPGKRPRLTPNPAIAIGDDGAVMPFGTPGGDVQCQAMVQTLLNVTLFGLNPQAAVEAPRFASFSFPNSFAPHAYHPGLLKLESRIPDTVADDLAGRGHIVDRWDDWQWQAGAMCLIQGDAATGVLSAGADPRRACYAAGW